MNEKRNLNILKGNFLNLAVQKNDATLFVSEINGFINQFIFLCEEMMNEALLTPAGKRWFYGQLSIYHTVEYFFNKLIMDRNRDIIKEKGPLELQNLCKVVLGELEHIIQSGTGRYITG